MSDGAPSALLRTVSASTVLSTPVPSVLHDDPSHAALRERLTALIHARPDDAGPLRQAVGTA